MRSSLVNGAPSRNSSRSGNVHPIVATSMAVSAPDARPARAWLAPLRRTRRLLVSGVDDPRAAGVDAVEDQEDVPTRQREHPVDRERA